MGCVTYQDVGGCNWKASQNEPENSFLAQFRPFLNNIIKTVTYISDSLPCIESLVKISSKVDYIFEGVRQGQKAT